VSDERYFEREGFLGPDGGWVGNHPGHKKRTTRTPSVVDIPSSETSTKDVVLSTTDEPSTTDGPLLGTEPSTGDRPVSTWRVKEFAQAHGWPKGQRLSKSEFVTWKLRLEVESGHRRPHTVATGSLPPDVHPIVKRSYEGFTYLLACRWNHTPGDPAPWTHAFAARWCGITERQAKDARRELVELKVLVHVGDSGRAKLWLPRGIASEGQA
jgi:hypothetical protein